MKHQIDKNMNNLFKVKYQITDEGVTYPEYEVELSVRKSDSVYLCLKQQLTKYRHALDLSRKFIVNIISEENIGYSN